MNYCRFCFSDRNDDFIVKCISLCIDGIGVPPLTVLGFRQMILQGPYSDSSLEKKVVWGDTLQKSYLYKRMEKIYNYISVEICFVVKKINQRSSCNEISHVISEQEWV